jgi:hypothetical protein
MYTKRRHEAFYIQDVNDFIEAAKRHALIKQTKDIYYPCVDCRNSIVCRDLNTIRSHLVCRRFIENYEIWDHHGERRTKAGNMEGTNPPEVRKDDDAHRVMMHDGLGDDAAGGGTVVAKAVVGRMMVKTMKNKTS